MTKVEMKSGLALRKVTMRELNAVETIRVEGGDILRDATAKCTQRCVQTDDCTGYCSGGRLTNCNC